MTEDEIAAAFAKVKQRREGTQKKLLRPYMREHFASISRLRSPHKRESWAMITETLADLGVVDANGRHPTRAAVHQAYQIVEREKIAERKAGPPQIGRPANAPRRHSSKIFD